MNATRKAISSSQSNAAMTAGVVPRTAPDATQTRPMKKMMTLEEKLAALGYIDPAVIDEISERAAILHANGEESPDSLAQVMTLGCEVVS